MEKNAQYRRRRRPRPWQSLPPRHQQTTTILHKTHTSMCFLISLILVMNCQPSQGFLSIGGRTLRDIHLSFRQRSMLQLQSPSTTTEDNQNHTTTAAASLHPSSHPQSPPLEAFQTQFHQDMRRILDTRRDMFQRHPDHEIQTLYAPFCPWFDSNDDDDGTIHHQRQQQHPSSHNEADIPNNSVVRHRPRILNRRHRPPLITHDFDGAERVHQMWGQLRNKQQQSQQSLSSSMLESYIICMQAYLQRGRLRWKQTVVINTFDSTSQIAQQEEDDEASSSAGTLDELFSIDEDEDDDDHEDNESHSDKRSTQSTTTPAVVCSADVIHDLYHDWLQQRGEPNHDPVWNPAAACWLVAQAICSTQRGNRNYASRALAFIESLRQQDPDDVPVEALFYGINAAAWQQGNLQKGSWAQQADDIFSELLEQLETREEQSSSSSSIHLWGSYYPSSWTSTEMRMQAAAWTLEAWSKHGSSNGAVRAQAILDQMIAWNHTSESTIESVDSFRPSQEGLYLDADAYSNAILAWAKAGKPERAQALLVDLISLYRQGSFPNHCAEPPLIAFNSVISAWGKKQETEKAVRVLKILQQVQQECASLVPDTVAYNSILHSFSNSDDEEKCAMWASALVKYMETNQDRQPTIKPNAFTYHTYIKCLIRGLKLVQRGRNRDSSSEQNLLDRIEAALICVEKLWKAGDTTVEPNNRIFNMVINAYAKSRNRSASEKAFEILKRMKQSKSYKPDIITMTSVMECLSKSSSSDAPKQALALLDDAVLQYEKKQKQYLMPNVRIFSMAILTLSLNQGKVADARRLLNQLVDLYEETKHEDLRPNEYPYNYVLNCAANSQTEDKQMKEKIFRMATQTYKEMRQSSYVEPDSFTYGFWLKCCNNLLYDMDLRSKCVSYAFNECKQGGLLTDEILTRLYQGSPPALVNEVLELNQGTSPNYRVGSLQIKDLPIDWSRNVRRPNKRQR